MARPGLRFDSRKGEFAREILKARNPIAFAATAAVREVGEAIKSEGRADIANAGFNKRWQNAFRVSVYPKTGVSMGAAAYVYHNIPYADAFEKGGVIEGKPILWIWMQRKVVRLGKEKMTPKLFWDRIGPLSYVSKGGSSYLVAKVGLGPVEAKRDGPIRITLQKLRNGAAGVGVIRSVPVFHGQKNVNMPNKFSLREITQREAGTLVRRYARNIVTG